MLPLPESKPEEFTEVALLTVARNRFQDFATSPDSSDDVRKWWAQRVAAIDAWLVRLSGEPDESEPDEAQREGAITRMVAAFKERTSYWAPELFGSDDHLEELAASMLDAADKTDG